jgi:hypothetical protein
MKNSLPLIFSFIFSSLVYTTEEFSELVIIVLVWKKHDAPLGVYLNIEICLEKVGMNHLFSYV